MPKKWMWLLALCLAACWMARATPGQAGVPDVTNSFYVPQVGSVGTPTEGAGAARLFRMCPNNDGGTSLPNNARIKVVVKDVNGNAIAGIAAADICLLFNGGTGTGLQGFTGVGADSIIANSQYNTNPLCPDVRCVAADAPTDANGVAYITFAGADPSNPGVTLRSANRKWGHFDSEIPVFVLGFKISGRLTTASANGTYVLRIKSYDVSGGLAATTNAGEQVQGNDFTTLVSNFGKSNAITYWVDFSGDAIVGSADFTAMVPHIGHTCAIPLP